MRTLSGEATSADPIPHFPLVVTIVLNNNRLDDALVCLDSLGKSTYPNNHIIVLNVGTSPEALETLRGTLPAVEVVALAENRGYAGNNNIGLEMARARGADWAFLLNEDTVVDPHCLSQLVQGGERDVQIGIVGPTVYHFDEPEVIQSAGGVLGRDDWQPEHVGQNVRQDCAARQPYEVDWVSGCAILVRRALIEQIGMFDERFFMYWEEIDWCLRARKRGWRIMHIPQAKLWHKGVQRDYRPSPDVTYYSTRNRFLLLAMHRAPFTAWLVSGSQTLRTLVSWTFKPKWRGMREHRDAMWQGIWDFLRHRWGVHSAC